MRGVIASAVVALLMLAIACSVDVDLSNKACPCVAGFVCDTSQNLCVAPSALKASTGSSACSGDDACPAGTYCNARSQCIAGCRASADCAKISPASPLCATDRHQCVACLTTKDCTSADESCSPSGVCVVSCSPSKACAGGGACCGGLCVDTTQDPLNCSACGTACSTDNASPACATSACAFSCASGFAHCGTGNTGCETNTATDAKNCGGCGTDCSTKFPNVADASCTSGTCSYTTCKAGFGDFDSDKTNGCETPCGNKGDICCPNRTCLPGNSCNGGNHCN